MGLQLSDAVAVAVDLEVEAPVLIDARLPSIFAFVVLLGVQSWMSQIAHQETDLLDEGLLNRQRAPRPVVQWPAVRDERSSMGF